MYTCYMLKCKYELYIFLFLSCVVEIDDMSILVDMIEDMIEGAMIMVVMVTVMIAIVTDTVIVIVIVIAIVIVIVTVIAIVIAIVTDTATAMIDIAGVTTETAKIDMTDMIVIHDEADHPHPETTAEIGMIKTCPYHYAFN